MMAFAKPFPSGARLASESRATLHLLEMFEGHRKWLSHGRPFVEEREPIDGIVSALEHGLQARHLPDLQKEILLPLVLLAQVIALRFDEYLHDGGLAVVGTTKEQDEVRLERASLFEIIQLEQLLVPDQVKILIDRPESRLVIVDKADEMLFLIGAIAVIVYVPIFGPQVDQAEAFDLALCPR